MKDSFVEYAYRVVKNCERYIQKGDLNKSEIIEARFDEPSFLNNHTAAKLQYAFNDNKRYFDIHVMNHILSYIPGSSCCIIDKLPIHSNLFKLPQLSEVMFHGFISYVFNQIEYGKILWVKDQINENNWIVLFEDAFYHRYIDALTLYYYTLIFEDSYTPSEPMQRFFDYVNYRANRELVYKFVDTFEKIKKITKMIIKKYEEMIQ